MLGCSLAIAHKGRPRHNAAEVMGIIGDIEGKTCVINDDMIDTAGTLCASVRELKKMGAGDIYVCATHGIFSGPAVERLNDAPIVECVVTDSIPVEVGGKIKTISVAEEFANAIAASTARRACPSSWAATSRCSVKRGAPHGEKLKRKTGGPGEHSAGAIFAPRTFSGASRFPLQLLPCAQAL